MAKLTAEERYARQQARDAKREARTKVRKSCLTETMRDAIRSEVERIITSEYRRYVDEAAKIRLHDQLAQTPDEQVQRIHNRTYTEFTTEQLINIFGGWYTLRYLFSVKSTSKDVEIETDYYVCSRDVSLMDINSRPKLNEPIFKQFGVEVYGYAIIAPSTAFK